MALYPWNVRTRGMSGHVHITPGACVHNLHLEWDTPTCMYLANATINPKGTHTTIIKTG